MPPEADSPEAAQTTPGEAQVSRVRVVLDEPPPRRAAARITRADALFAILLAIVLVVGAWLRFDAQNWDDYTHLHPDERFLTDVVSSLGRSLSFTDATLDEQDRHRQRCEQRYPARVIGDGEDQTITPAGHGPLFRCRLLAVEPEQHRQGTVRLRRVPAVHREGGGRGALAAFGGYSHISPDVRRGGRAKAHDHDPLAGLQRRPIRRPHNVRAGRLADGDRAAVVGAAVVRSMGRAAGAPRSMPSPRSRSNRRISGRWTRSLPSG